jgi:hypothetical protein
MSLRKREPAHVELPTERMRSVCLAAVSMVRMSVTGLKPNDS